MSGVVQLTPEGSADTTFDRGTGFGGHDLLIYCLALQPDGKILVGGEFESYKGVPVQGLVRLNPDGSLDSAFHITNRPFLGTHLAVQPDGKILVAVEESNTNYVVRLNPDGTPDPSFKVVADALGPMVLHGDGRILLRSATGVARLNPDGTRDPVFVTEVVPSFVFALGDIVCRKTMIATIRVEQFIHCTQLFPHFDTIHLAFLVDTDEIPKDPSPGSAFVLIFDEGRRLVPTPLFYGTTHWTAPGAGILSDSVSLLTGRVFFHFAYR